MAARGNKRDELMSHGWVAKGGWWHHRGVGQGYRIETAWKKMQEMKTADGIQKLVDFIGPKVRDDRDKQAELQKARDAVIRAAKFYDQNYFGIGCEAITPKAHRLFLRAVARLRKLEGK